MVASLARREITAPTEIQTLTVPPGLSGRDICGKAPTGSGKTIAFGLILVERLRNHAQGRPSGLVLVPTRELAQQVQREIHLLDVDRKYFTTSVFGGAGYGPQVQRLRRCSIVVATPGRLEDLMKRRDIDLRDVRMVVIDEADRMADMGFLPSVKRILDRVPRERQMLLFSATLDGAVGSIVKDYLSNPLQLATKSADAEPDIEHVFEVLMRADRAARVGELVHDGGLANSAGSSGALTHECWCAAGRVSRYGPKTMSCGRTGVRGSSRPVAARIAATIAGVTEMQGGSPMPLAPRGACGSGSSIIVATTSGASRAVGRR
ncbi:MAG: DEAD/DEAH box helicase [Acidimicrobiia bacterium]|nr:DEAD/DEAH box helicase [Acidimicrobiia bacterium]